MNSRVNCTEQTGEHRVMLKNDRVSRYLVAKRPANINFNSLKLLQIIKNPQHNL